MKRKRTSPPGKPPACQSPPAEKIGKYKILGTLGRGGMGVVYKGLDPDIEREVAIKTIRLDTIGEDAEKQEMLVRVVREAKAAGRLDHPNIITIYDVIHEGDLTFIVMQYVDGQSLQSRIDAGVRFSPREVIDLLKPIADALDYAHQHGIVHRDVKPANILIDKRGKPLLADFGVAHIETSTMTAPGKTIGTLSYMSPEQVMGAAVDHRADNFALGVILYELLTGKRPFGGDNLSTIVFKIVNEEPPRVTEINHDLPSGYEEVVKTALAKNPEERYQSGRAMIAALEDPDKFSQTTRAYDGNAPREGRFPSAPKRRLALAGGVLGLAALAGVGIIALVRGGGNGRAASDLRTLKPGDISPTTRSAEIPPLPASPSSRDQTLARIRASLDNQHYDEAAGLARKMLDADPSDAQAKDFLEKAAAATRVEQVRPFLERGMADFSSADYQACMREMERALKIDKDSAEAKKYFLEADRAISKAEIMDVLERYRVAEESNNLPAVLDPLGSPALRDEARRQYREWFNGYDGIRSRVFAERSCSFADRSTAELSFSQRIYGTDKKDKKKRILFEGPKIWELKKVGETWKIVSIVSSPAR